jgi:hypothetical protein
MAVDQEGVMGQTNKSEERRKFPRSFMDLPIEYRITDLPRAHGGVVINGSETGLLVHSVKDMPIGTNLNISVLFPERFQLTNFDVVAEIVRKDVCWEENWHGFEYGLRFVWIKPEDAGRLKQLLKNRFRSK